MTYSEWCKERDLDPYTSAALYAWWSAFPPDLAEPEFVIAATQAEITRILAPLNVQVYAPEVAWRATPRSTDAPHVWHYTTPHSLPPQGAFPFQRRGVEYWERAIGGQGVTLKAAAEAAVENARTFATNAEAELAEDLAWGLPLVGKRLRVIRAWESEPVRLEPFGRTPEERSALYRRKLHPQLSPGRGKKFKISPGMEGVVVEHRPDFLKVEFASSVWFPEMVDFLRELGHPMDRLNTLWVSWNMWDYHTFRVPTDNPHGKMIKNPQPYFEVIQ